MKKLSFYLMFFLVLISSVVTVLAVTDPGLQSLMKRGNIISCLKAVNMNANQDEWKSVDASMKLTGLCQSKSNCDIWRCNGINNEIAEDEDLIKKCKSGKINRPVCDKIDDLERKIKKSVEVKVGCQKITDFTPSVSLGKAAYGNINVVSKQKFVPHVDYKFYSVGEAGPTASISPTIKVNNGVKGNDSSQQIGEIQDFKSVPIPTVPPGSKQDCTGITWDPFGRVFDSVSLEPISDVEVTMIDNTTKKPAIQQFEDNFDITNMSGVFNILVEKVGEYMLSVAPPPTHLFTKNPELNQNYSQIYSDLYYPENVFTEKQGVPTHHDIPLEPQGAPYHQTEINIVPDSLNQIDMGDFISYGGRTTYPKTLVCLLGESSKKQSGVCVNTDKIGKFSLNIDKAVIPQGERLIIQLKKVDLTSSLFPPIGQAIYPVDNNGKNYGYEPILNYIEGQTSPKTKVVVRSGIDESQFYETLSDDSGLFAIGKNNLPIFEYYLEFTDSNNNLTKLTTSEFVKKNQAYLDSGKINLMQGTKYSQKIVDPTTGKLNKIDKNYVPTQQNKESDAAASKKVAFDPAVLIIILVITLLVIVTVGLAFYIEKSKSF